MILPTKHIRIEKTLLGIGATILELLKEPKTMSALWDEVRRKDSIEESTSVLDYKWFVLTLDFLHIVGLVDFKQGLLIRTKRRNPQ